MLKLDNNIAHDSRVNRDKPVGAFCDVPIVTLDKLGMDADVLLDLHMRLRFSSGTSIPAEVMPGESICEDHIIRRTTTAEAIGEDYYLSQELTEANTQRVPIDAARSLSKAGLLISWRPNRDTNPQTEYALTHAEA